MTTTHHAVLVKLPELVLKRKDFEFSDKHYLSVQEASIGIKMVASYVNIFIERLEKRLLRASVHVKPQFDFVSLTLLI